MGTRGRRRAVLAVLTALVLTGCGSASDPSPPAGVDGLVIPTPSIDADDFVTGVDNPWLPLPIGATWRYALAGTSSGDVTVTTQEGPDIEGVATTAVHTQTVLERERRTVTDFYAQDEAGNVWWFGREGEWQAGVDGAEAGLVMAADPRVGDGYRQAEAPGIVDRRAEVLGLDGERTVPDGAFDNLLTIAITSQPTGVVEQGYYAEGIGMVELATLEGEPETQLGLVDYDEP